MLSHVRIWRFTLRTQGELSLPGFVGPMVRGVIGRAMFEQLGPEAATAIFEPHAGAPCFRVDTPLHPQRVLPRSKRWHLRLITFNPDIEDAVLNAFAAACATGFRDNRVPQEISDVATLSHGGQWAPVIDAALPPSIELRADELFNAGAVTIRLASPARIKRGKELVRFPELQDVLVATAHRVRELQLDASGLGRFDDRSAELPGTMTRWHHPRHSQAQDRDYSLDGVVGGFAAALNRQQARWIALAEILGVGAKTAYGMGVIRAAPVGGFAG